MEEKIELHHLETLFQKNKQLHKRKSLVFEISNYTSEQGLNLILCWDNIGSSWERAFKFRQSDTGLDGRFSYEYDGINFLKTEKKEDILFAPTVLTTTLEQTLHAFQEFAEKRGFSFCKPLGFFDETPGNFLYHVWMGNDLGVTISSPETLVNDWSDNVLKLLRAQIQEGQIQSLQNVALYFSNEYYDLQMLYVNNTLAAESEQALEQVAKLGDRVLSGEAIEIYEEGISFTGTPLEAYKRLEEIKSKLSTWFPELKPKLKKGLTEDGLYELLEEVRMQLVYRVAAAVEQKAKAGAIPVPVTFQAYGFVHDTPFNKALHEKVR